MEVSARKLTLARFAVSARQDTFVRDVDERPVKRVWSRTHGCVQTVVVVLSWRLQPLNSFRG